MDSIGGATAKKLIFTTIIMALNFTLLTGLPILSTISSSGRFLAETRRDSGSSRYLDDTVRVDPLDGLKKYRGGYDITNEHYWSSTAFTGIYGYSIAVAWLLCGLGYGGCLLARRCCWRGKDSKKRTPCHRNCYFQLSVLAVVLTLFSIVGIGLVLGGNAGFHSRAETVKDIVIGTADEASDTIYNTTRAMREISTSIGDVNGDPEATRFLISTSQSLDSQAADIAREASRGRRLVDKILNIAYIATTITISLTLASVIALLAFGILKFPKTVQVLIAACWILTALCWLFFGIYFFLHNFADDTCRALESFEKDPYNNSLSYILPCHEMLSAKSVLGDVSAGIYDLVNQVNNNISASYGNIVQICNPFSPPPLHQYQPWNCPSSSIKIGDIPRVLRQLACPDTGGETCNGGILIPAMEYNTIEAYTTSIQKVLDVYPGMDSLVECETVESAFSRILRNQCSPLKTYTRIVWAALLFLSIDMIALVVVWTARTNHHKRHGSSGGSVKPHAIAPQMLEYC